MRKMSNGWHVPDDDKKITFVLSNDQDMLNPSYEGKYREQIIRQIPNKNTFVDVGTNVGIWSLPMMHAFKTVISYEPSKQNLECLKANIPTGIDLREKAIANFTGVADFHQAGKNCGDGKLCRAGVGASYQVPVVKLDDENLTNVDLIKIDVQGWEYEVLDGAIELIKRDRPWVIFEVNEDIDKCCTLMESLDYETLLLKSKRLFLWAPRSGKNTPVNSDQFGRYLGPGPYAARLGGK
jgi:FkbM family methyltransferase